MPSPAQLPFQAAIDFFRGKIRLPSSGWTDIWQEQHSHAFVVAGAAQDALVEDLYNAVRKAQESGSGYAAFRADFEAISGKYGWAYKGSPGWRSKVTYSTNITQAYNAGRWQQMQAVKYLRPFWVYRHTPNEHPRLAHLAWDGMILPADDPWFDTHFPQNGWGCKCKVHSLSRSEAESLWSSKGMSGPDTAPPMDWEEKVVGAQGSQPRTVRVPRGIDPGFAYNPGRAWLEPMTVPPLRGYEAVLQERGVDLPRLSMPLPLATVLPVSALVSSMEPVRAVSDFLEVFGATLDQGAVFEDVTGTAVAITKTLFEDGQGQFKWLESAGKAGRLQYINLLAMTLADPDEVWWHWVKDRVELGRWRLKRRYIRAFELEGSKEFGLAVFEWGRSGWTGATTFMASQKSEAARRDYIDRQRTGRLVWARK